MNNSERGMQTSVPGQLLEQAEMPCGEVDPHILRIRRLGKRLFGVANCIVRLGRSMPEAIGAGRSVAAVESAFCYALPLSESPLVVVDASRHEVLRSHPAVASPPNIRFFASYPVFSEKTVIGAVCLIDYSPRLFTDGDRQALSDLALLVEREVQLRSVNASQLDLQRKNKNLRRKSLIDPLIGTWNRRAIMRILQLEAARCQKEREPLSVIVADLDYFKRINDTHGHPAGDAVLIKVASKLRSCIRPQEALGRYGGEEFLIVLPGSSGKTAMAVAERMRLVIAAQPEDIGTAQLNLSISAGVASTDLFPNASVEELIRRADTALYSAKEAGRNRAVQALPESL